MEVLLYLGLPTKNEHDNFSCPQKFIAYPQPHEILKCQQNKNPLFNGFFCYKGRLMGLEPMSAGATIQCVNQLHHSRHVLKYIIISKSNRQHIFLVILKIEVLYIHGTN